MTFLSFEASQSRPPFRRLFALGVRYFLLAELLAVVLALLSRFIFSLFGIELEQQEAVSLLSNPDTSLFDTCFLVFASVFLSPVCEEFVFRICLLDFILKKTKKVALSVFAVSLIFAICHWNLAAFAPLFGVSVAFSLALVNTKAWIIPIFSHSLYNLTAVAVALSSRFI